MRFFTAALIAGCLVGVAGCYNVAPAPVVPPANNTTIIQQPVQEKIIIREEVRPGRPCPPPTPLCPPPQCPPPRPGIGIHIDLSQQKGCCPERPCGRCNKCRPSLRIGVEINK